MVSLLLSLSAFHAHRKKVAAAGSATALSILVQFRYIRLCVKPFLYTPHIVLTCNDCRMGVNLCETGAFIPVNSFFERGCSPKLHIAENTFQFHYRFLELDNYCPIIRVHSHIILIIL